MSASRAKKVKMATKSCPECDQQVPVACKSCPCGYIFISRKLLNAKHPEKSPPSTECVDTFFGIASAKPQTAVDSREHSEASEGPVTASCVTAPAPAWGAQLWAGLFWGLLGSQGALSVFCVWDVSKCIYKKTKQKAG
ncbi:UPF0547 protein C16orf87 homolog isoform X3 [Myotis daubentonii]|uniref:UPF0547 protein C16orf87 homolog isoform X3 n=1 Tax=Myotis daubentonii TaxID=98922 RepID=UPI0028737533|nr:UPF0547 protein C16orf87 homolog isoform X3 [Myotis daubentonii]